MSITNNVAQINNFNCCQQNFYAFSAFPILFLPWFNKVNFFFYPFLDCITCYLITPKFIPTIMQEFFFLLWVSSNYMVKKSKGPTDNKFLRTMILYGRYIFHKVACPLDQKWSFSIAFCIFWMQCFWWPYQYKLFSVTQCKDGWTNLDHLLWISKSNMIGV